MRLPPGHVDALKAYRGWMQRACVFGVLTEDLYVMDTWLRQEVEDLDKVMLNLLQGPGDFQDSLTEIQELLCEVREHKSRVEGVIRAGRSYLAEEYDALLCLDVASLERHWLQLKHTLHALNPDPATTDPVITPACPWTSHPDKRTPQQPLSKKAHPLPSLSQLQPKHSHRRVLGNSTGSFETNYSVAQATSAVSLLPHLTIPPTAGRVTCTASTSCDFSSLESPGSSSADSLSLSNCSTGSLQKPYCRPIVGQTQDIVKCVSLSNFNTVQALPNHLESNLRRKRSRSEFEGSCDRSTSKESIDCGIPNGHSPIVSNFDEARVIARRLRQPGVKMSKPVDISGARNRGPSGLTTLRIPSSPLNIARSNLGHMKSSFPSSLGDLSSDQLPTSPRPNTRASPCSRDMSPVRVKRRRMNTDTPSPTSSPVGSPLPHSIEAGLAGLVDSFDESGNRTLDEFSDSNVSSVSSPGGSPAPFRKGDAPGKRYRKDELWAAIRSDYQYLMDEEIIETCKLLKQVWPYQLQPPPTPDHRKQRSTESDFSWESDDLTTNTKVSFAEFVQQYKELTEWLNHIQLVTQRQSSSLSEKYLNQTYHEEMLQRSPRRKLFSDYAKQLMRRYPSMKEEISTRLTHLNRQWEMLEAAISPQHGYLDEETMLKDLEQDLNGLRKWLHDVENQLLPLCLDSMWTTLELEDKLKEHQVLQLEIESHSKIVSAVLKLCERLQTDQRACSNECEKESLQLVAINLERRWHAIWLQSLEWQCRLEEAIKTGIPVRRDAEWEGSFYQINDGARLTRNERLHDVFDGENSDDSHCIGDPLDSDNSDCDVIPFLDYEYEKITVDTDVQTDGFYGKVTPSSSSISSSGREEGCDLDQGFDSALGRSVSDDHSLNTDLPPCLPLSGTLTRTGPKVVSFACDMKATEDPSEEQRSSKMENTDVGYSSESHSNDERDLGSQLPNSPSLDEVDGSTLADRKGLALDEVVLRRKVDTDSTDATPSPSTHEKSWRHSMTSAYDSCSNCSDLNSPQDLELSLDTTADTTTDTIATVIDAEEAETKETCENVKVLISSPSRSFYRMTSVEGDTDHSVASQPDNTSAHSPLPSDDSCSPANYALSCFNHSTPIKGLSDNDTNSYDRTLRVNRRLPVSDVSLSPVSFAKFSKLRSDSLDVEVDSEACIREQDITAEDLDTGASSTQPCNGSTDSIQQLIQQADLLVRDNELPISKRRKKKAKRHRRRGTVLEVIPSVEVTKPQTVDDPNRHSACDASSEGTSSSESESEYSTASSETDDRLPTSVTLTNGSVSSSIARSDLSLRQGGIAAEAAAKLRALAKSRDRPCSITELYELTNRLDLSPFSISESAIDDISRQYQAMQPAAVNRMRRANSEVASIPVRRFESPRKRRRKLKRGSSSDTDHASRVTLSPSNKTSRSTVAHQSSQEWRTLSSGGRSGSDLIAQCQNLEQIKKVLPSGSESELESADAVVHPGPCESDDTDAVHKSMNSTMESFSENAWDNYQELPYASISDDPTEEKLDDSALQWEGLELDEEFYLDSTYIAPTKERRVSCVKAPVPLYTLEPSHVSDSDSDLEDLHDVFEQSWKQIRLTENMLQKPHKDTLGTGIYLEPLKYAEMVATCRTNLRCLQVVGEALDNSETPSTVSNTDFQEAHDIVMRWEELEELAVLRQQQSRDLSLLFKDMQEARSMLQDLTEDLATTGFEDVDDLERGIKAVQSSKLELHQVRSNLAPLEQAISSFAQSHPSVQMSGFQTELANLHQAAKDAEDRAGLRGNELQSCLISWYDFKETCKELSYLLSGELRQLDCFNVLAPNLARLSQPDLLRMISDLKAMQSEFAVYDEQLNKLRELSAEVTVVCSDATRAEQEVIISSAEGQLTAIQDACSEMVATMETHKSPKVDASTATDDDLEVTVPRQRCHLLLRLLKATMPLQVALVVALGMAYLIEPELGNLGLNFSPQLRYVRGPPPT